MFSSQVFGRRFPVVLGRAVPRLAASALLQPGRSQHLLLWLSYTPSFLPRRVLFDFYFFAKVWGLFLSCCWCYYFFLFFVLVFVLLFVNSLSLSLRCYLMSIPFYFPLPLQCPFMSHFSTLSSSQLFHLPFPSSSFFPSCSCWALYLFFPSCILSPLSPNVNIHHRHRYILTFSMRKIY